MKKERMIIAFLSLLFLLPGCKEEKTQSVFDADEFDCVGWPHIRKVTITNVNCFNKLVSDQICTSYSPPFSVVNIGSIRGLGVFTSFRVNVTRLVAGFGVKEKL